MCVCCNDYRQSTDRCGPLLKNNRESTVISHIIVHPHLLFVRACDGRPNSCARASMNCDPWPQVFKLEKAIVIRGRAKRSTAISNVTCASVCRKFFSNLGKNRESLNA